jgi:hypothetical protein
MSACLQFLLGSKLGQAMVGTGWLTFLGSIGYMIVDHQITVSSIEDVLTKAAPLLAGLAAGGGVHFIYNRNGKNGATH